jgi:serine/threonine protein kinase
MIAAETYKNLEHLIDKAVYADILPWHCGGEGCVFRAFHQGMEEERALKLLKNDKPKEWGLKEKEIYSLCKSPAWVPLLDVHSKDKYSILVFKWIKGVSLREVLSKQSFLAESLLLKGFLRLARALEELHAQGWVHGDISPDNILVDEEGEFYLLDLGLAQRAGESNVLQANGAYISPAAFSGEACSINDDLFSLGSCLYFALTANDPFVGESWDELNKRIYGRQTDWSLLKEEAKWRSLVEACWQGGGAGELEDAEELAEILEIRYQELLTTRALQEIAPGESATCSTVLTEYQSKEAGAVMQAYRAAVKEKQNERAGEWLRRGILWQSDNDAFVEELGRWKKRQNGSNVKIWVFTALSMLVLSVFWWQYAGRTERQQQGLDRIEQALEERHEQAEKDKKRQISVRESVKGMSVKKMLISLPEGFALHEVNGQLVKQSDLYLPKGQYLLRGENAGEERCYNLEVFAEEKRAEALDIEKKGYHLERQICPDN